MNGLDKAIKHFGGMAALGKAIKLTSKHPAMAVYQWKTRKRVPAQHVLSIERATDGEVTRHELRPDLYPSE